MDVLIKRAYDQAEVTDGYRVFVDRLWPRGVKKELLQLDEWDKDIAPSTELRKWFGHDPVKFKEFSARYIVELRQTSAAKKLLKRAVKHNTLTLVYAAKDSKVNHAIVLQKYLQEIAHG